MARVKGREVEVNWGGCWGEEELSGGEEGRVLDGRPSKKKTRLGDKSSCSGEVAGSLRWGGRDIV